MRSFIGRADRYIPTGRTSNFRRLSQELETQIGEWVANRRPGDNAAIHSWTRAYMFGALYVVHYKPCEAKEIAKDHQSYVRCILQQYVNHLKSVKGMEAIE